MDRFDRSSRARRRGALIALALVGTLLPALPAGTVAAEGSGSTTQYQPTQGRISAGLHHACAVLDSGDVTCWGQGAQGALGYGNTANIGDTETVAQNPVGGGLVALPGGAKATAVAAGNSSTCALLATGRVTCWGDGAHGQLGYGNTADIGDTETPAQNPVNGGIVPLPGNALATEIGAGNGFACALLAGGTVTCWGSGAAGELGYGNTADIGDTETPAQNPVNGGIVPLPAGRSAVRIAVGGGSVCALLDDGTVTCWGYGADGRLGYGNTANIGDTETPAQNPANGGIVRLTNAAGVTAAAISVGGSSACAVLSTQQLVCWGDAGLGQLGYGNTADIGDTETPADNPVGGGIVAVPAPPGGAAGSALVVSVDVGAYQTCALLTTHEVACWGAGAGGELGYGNTANIGDTKTPAQNNVNGGIVAQGRPTVAVTAGGFFSCALLQGGTLDCWGLAADGQLGYGNTENIGDDETPAQNPVNNGDVPLPGGQVITQLYVPITPARVLDTRAGGTTIDGKAAGGGPIQAGTELYLNIAGRAGVPYDSTSVTMNVAVTNAVADGFLTVHPCGDPPPNAANLNYTAGQTVAGSVTVRRGIGGAVCLFAYSTVDVVVDVGGYEPFGSKLVTVEPARLLDTRSGYSTIDGQFQATGALGAGHEVELVVAGRGGVPSDASAVVLNVAAVDPAAAGFVTAYPCGASRPNAANLNYVAGQIIPNSVTVKVGVAGKVCLYTYATTHLVADVDAYVAGGAAFFQAVVPARLLDTRPGYTTVDGQSQAGGVIPAGGTLEVQIAGRGGVPGGATAAALNIAVTESLAAGFITAYPCGAPRPNAASVNHRAGETIPNALVVKIGAGGKICFYSLATTHLVVDVDGFVL